jgi:hypothetical protein
MKALPCALEMLEAGGQQRDHAHVHFVGIRLELPLEGGWYLEVEGAQVLVGAAAEVGRRLEFWRWRSFTVGGWFTDFCHNLNDC